MKIINILGGLGNQMFQYALAIALKHQHKEEEIKIDISNFHCYPLHNGFELNKIFHCSIETASFKDIIKVGYPFMNYQLWRIGRRILPKRKSMITGFQNKEFPTAIMHKVKDAYFDGYWQSECFFNEYRAEVLKEFTFPPFTEMVNIELANKIKSTPSVSLHIRRGDYINNKTFEGICTIKYYRNAIKTIRELTNVNQFIIFSNDIEWTKDAFKDEFSNESVIYVDWNKGENSYRDMQLMSLCQYNIVANSSFSWWGAWLNNNPQKIVIAPYKWTNRINENDYIPSDWIRITDI